MFPFQKVLTLMIRTFSRPMLNFIRANQSSRLMTLTYTRSFFIATGRMSNRVEHWMNHKILKTSHKKQVSELKDELLLDKGVEAIFELIFYSIVIGIPLYEYYQAQVSANAKEAKMQEDVDQMRKKMMGLQKSAEDLTQHIEKAHKRTVKLEQECKVKLEQRRKERAQKRRARLLEEDGPRQQQVQQGNNASQSSKPTQ